MSVKGESESAENQNSKQSIRELQASYPMILYFSLFYCKSHCCAVRVNETHRYEQIDDTDVHTRRI